jgi:hypothetical protein
LPGDEQSKAIQEVAKTATKAIGAAEKFGGFVARLVSGSLEQGIGIFEDKLRYARWERQARLMTRASELMRKLGESNFSRAIPLKLALPLLQAASVEDDDYLQDLWARLLVGAATGVSQADLTRAHIAMLEQLSSFEARILGVVYALPYEAARHAGVLTEDLPIAAKVRLERDQSTPRDPDAEVCLALSNLDRVSCILVHRSMGGGEYFSVVHPTRLGLSLIQAYTLRPNR